jgi:hypothetical protein
MLRTCFSTVPSVTKIRRAMPALDVRGQHDDRRSGQFFADYLCRLQALGGVGRWHSDVDNRQIRTDRTDQGEEFYPVPDLADDVETETVKQAGQAFAQQDVVVGEHDPGRAPVL